MKAAVAKAAESISGITGVEVIKMNARVTDGLVTQYRVNCKIAFAVR
jgi:flavin-binding protein dodecin